MDAGPKLKEDWKEYPTLWEILAQVLDGFMNEKPQRSQNQLEIKLTAFCSVES